MINNATVSALGFTEEDDALTCVEFPPDIDIRKQEEGVDTLKGGTLNAEEGLTRFAIRYMCTHHYFSIEKARRDLGYNPSVGVDEGIERTCQHLEATGAV